MRLAAVVAVIFGLVGTAVLIGLGVWQIKRLAVKEAHIAGIERRLAQDPVAVPERLDPVRDDFLRVAASGTVDGRELHVLTSLKPWGPGFRVIAPLTDAAGRVILVDLGYVPEAAKDAGASRAGPLSVVGALYWPNETDGFTPAPDRGANIWFARDLTPMADALGAEPVLIVADSHDRGEWVKPRRLGVNLPNDHLQYAITWFSLALVWAVMSTMLVRRERRRSAGD